MKILLGSEQKEHKSSLETEAEGFSNVSLKQTYTKKHPSGILYYLYLSRSDCLMHNQKIIFSNKSLAKVLVMKGEDY